MIKNLTAIGNSLGIIIDKPVLDLLGIDKDTPLEVKTDGEGLMIRPIKDAGAARSAVEKAKAQDPGPPPPPAKKAPAKADKPPAPPPPADAPAAPPPPAAETPAPPPTVDEPRPAADSGGIDVIVELKGDEVSRTPFDGDELIIGREKKKCDVHLDDRALSRRHAKLEKRGASIWVSDLGSANGTFVNGQEIKQPTRLNGGDEVSLGHYKVMIAGLEEAAANTPVLTLNGPEGMHRFALVGEQIVIGRAQTCDISIGHKSISRRHLRIAQDGDGFAAEDLGSQNGCKLNGDDMDGLTPFKAGDVIEMCEFTLELGFLEPEPAAPTSGSGKPNKPRTMLIDRTGMLNAAYVEGDLDAAEGANLALGAKKKAKGPKGDTGNFDIGPAEQASIPPPPPAAKKKKGKVSVQGKGKRG